MADARHIENRFWLYLSAIGPLLAGWCEIWNRDEKSHADIGHVTKMAILENSSGGRPPFWKQLYLHISAVNYPISINFGKHSYHLQLIKMCTFRAPGKGSAVGVTECGGCHPTYKMHNQNNENVKWYFRDTSYNGWPLVWCHPEQLCLSRRRGFASPQSVYSTLFSPSVLLLIWRKKTSSIISDSSSFTQSACEPVLWPCYVYERSSPYITSSSWRVILATSAAVKRRW